MAERVRDVMIPAPWTLSTACPLMEGARRMRQWGVREVFVVDGGRFRGVLTDADIVVVAIASGRPPTAVTVGDCHNPYVQRLSAEQLLDEAELASSRDADRLLPVVDGDLFVGAVWASEIATVG